MDIEKYKEAFKRGENIDFFFSKKAIIVWGSLFGVWDYNDVFSEYMGKNSGNFSISFFGFLCFRISKVFIC